MGPSSWALLVAVHVLVATHGVASVSDIPPVANVTRRQPVTAPYHPGAFREAPAFRNGDACPPRRSSSAADGRVHIAMTLDANYLRGTVAAVFSIDRKSVV